MKKLFLILIAVIAVLVLGILLISNSLAVELDEEDIANLEAMLGQGEIADEEELPVVEVEGKIIVNQKQIEEIEDYLISMANAQSLFPGKVNSDESPPPPIMEETFSPTMTLILRSIYPEEIPDRYRPLSGKMNVVLRFIYPQNNNLFFGSVEVYNKASKEWVVIGSSSLYILSHTHDGTDDPQNYEMFARVNICVFMTEIQEKKFETVCYGQETWRITVSEIEKKGTTSITAHTYAGNNLVAVDEEDILHYGKCLAKSRPFRTER